MSLLEEFKFSTFWNSFSDFKFGLGAPVNTISLSLFSTGIIRQPLTPIGWAYMFSLFLHFPHSGTRTAPPPCAAAALLPPAACAQPGPLVSSPVPHPAFKASQWHKQFAQPYFLLSESSELFLSRHRCCQASSGDGLPRHFPTLTKPDF
jgi:hypothetical protein